MKKILYFVWLGMILSSCSSNEPQVAERTAPRVVGYLPLWEVAEWNSVDVNMLSHCILSFATYSQDGFVGWEAEDRDVRHLVGRCRESGTKVMVALGGYGGFKTDDNPMRSVESRANIIGQVSKIVERYDLDGVDVDIEIEAKDPIWDGFDDFVAELRKKLGKDKLVTMAVGTWFTDSVKTETYQKLDFINLMAYDNAFGDGPVAPVEMAHEMIKYYVDRGVDSCRMTLGVPFYGYSAGGVTRDWSEIVALDSANVGRDYDPVNGIYYNGVTTLDEKIKIARKCGGIMIWQLAEDEYGERSLLGRIGKKINDQE